MLVKSLKMVVKLVMPKVRERENAPELISCIFRYLGWAL
jgi:hypothetical protein